MEAKSSDWLRGPSGPTVCRCCFAEGCYKDISTEYFWMGKREVYDEMLTQTFDINITFGRSTGPNSNSRLICEPCISRLRDAAEFKRQVQECERMFMDYLDPGSAAPLGLEDTPDAAQKDVKDVQVSVVQVKEEKGNSDDGFADQGGFDDDDDDDDDLDDQPLTRLATKVPKKESVDLFDLLDNAKGAKRKSTNKTKSSPAKKAKTKKETPKATTSKPKPEKKKKGVESKNLEAARQNAIIILKHSSAYPFQQAANTLRCCFCLDVYEDPKEFREHMDSQHANKDKSENVPKESDVLIRVDITDLSCKVCDHKPDNLDDLAVHLAEHDFDINISEPTGLVPFKLDSHRFVCVVCEKALPGFYQLSRHTVTHFGNFVCEMCGSSFGTHSGLKYHETFTHYAPKFTCRVCMTAFPTQDDKKAHVRQSTACMPAKCYICKERFHSWKIKERHLIEVHGKPKKNFPCTECDKVFEHRFQLYQHFKTIHTDDLKCQYCNKRFNVRITLNEHIAMHEGKKDLKCLVCKKPFRYSRGLKRHMEIHNRVTYSCDVCERTFLLKIKLEKHKCTGPRTKRKRVNNLQIV